MSYRLLLLRHGETDHNAGQRMQGQLDVALNDRGRRQARAVAPVLAARQPRMVISSDLRRAADTAAVIAETAGVVVLYDVRLRESHLGQWQGLTRAQVTEHDPAGLAAWRSDAEYAPPGGESKVEVATRALEVVTELGAEPGTVLVVAHGGLIAALTARMLEMPVSRWSTIGGLHNTAWAELVGRRVDGRPGWRLAAWNVPGHPGRAQ